MEIFAGTLLRNWKMVRLLGKGGMSEVYLVQDNLGRPYALKILSARLTGEESFRERFKVEAQIMASLNHPNIIALHSYFEEQGNYCLVMEYMEGGSLKELIRRTGPIPEELALPVFQQIAEALAYAHSQGIIHRDIKPSNIMISADGQYKLGDFGIARMQETEGLTKTGSRMGTLIYMSPEQINDSKHMDTKTDVYSLGVTLYEMLTGRAPYNETTESDFRIMEKIVHQDLPDPRTVYPHISQSTLDLLKLATCRDPSQRPQFDELLRGKTLEPASEAEPEPEPVLKSGQEPKIQITPDHDESLSREAEISISPADSISRKVVIIGWTIGLIAILTFIFVVINTNIVRGKKHNHAVQADTLIIENELIFVQGGTYDMGSNYGEEEEQPVHQVRVSSFYIAKYVVTQAEFAQYMQPQYDWESEVGLGDNYPAYNVSWYDAIQYCNLRSLAEGLVPCYTIAGSTNPDNWGSVPRDGNDTWDAVSCNFGANGYRLPTEAEWEFAARGGVKTQGCNYSGSNDPGSVAWYNENSGYKFQIVGTKAANELGLYDMSGNISELCWDWHSFSYYSSSPKNNPTGPTTGDVRLLRGGNYLDNAVYCRVSSRRFIPPFDGLFGFRLCRSAK